MGSEAARTELRSLPKLPLFSMIVPRLELPAEPSGMLTPPLETSASVPFRWEEEPGKPRPCTALITLPTTTHANGLKKSLDLPPRLLLIDPAAGSKITKTPSPTTVLDGPDHVGRSVFSSSSFRIIRRERERHRRRQGSFDSSSCSSRSPNERGQLLGPMALGKQRVQKGGRGLFGSFRLATLNLKVFKGEKNEAGGGCSSVISPSSSSMDIAGYSDEDDEEEEEEQMGGGGGRRKSRMRRNGSFTSLSHHVTRSHFWTAIYEGFKQVVPWKSRKSKKEGLIV